MLCEPVWIHDGVDKREWFEKGLEPDFSLMICKDTRCYVPKILI